MQPVGQYCIRHRLPFYNGSCHDPVLGITGKVGQLPCLQRIRIYVSGSWEGYNGGIWLLVEGTCLRVVLRLLRGLGPARAVSLADLCGAE